MTAVTCETYNLQYSKEEIEKAVEQYVSNDDTVHFIKSAGGSVLMVVYRNGSP